MPVNTLYCWRISLCAWSLFVSWQVKVAYINFLNHCYVDTEVEMKEIYTSNHMWKLFENFLVDICRVSHSVSDNVMSRVKIPLLYHGDYVSAACGKHMLPVAHMQEVWLTGCASRWYLICPCLGVQQHQRQEACRYHARALCNGDSHEYRHMFLQLSFLWPEHKPAGNLDCGVLTFAMHNSNSHAIMN